MFSGLLMRVSSLPGRPLACSASASSAETRAVRCSIPPSAMTPSPSMIFAWFGLHHGGGRDGRESHRRAGQGSRYRAASDISRGRSLRRDWDRPLTARRRARLDPPASGATSRPHRRDIRPPPARRPRWRSGSRSRPTIRTRCCSSAWAISTSCSSPMPRRPSAALDIALTASRRARRRADPDVRRARITRRRPTSRG